MPLEGLILPVVSTSGNDVESSSLRRRAIHLAVHIGGKVRSLAPYAVNVHIVVSISLFTRSKPLLYFRIQKPGRLRVMQILGVKDILPHPYHSSPHIYILCHGVRSPLLDDATYSCELESALDVFRHRKR